MIARALPEGWQIGPHPNGFKIDVNALVISNRVVAEFNAENFHEAVFTDDYPEDVKEYIIFRLEENRKYEKEKARLWHEKVVSGVIDCVRSEMKVEESC